MADRDSAELMAHLEAENAYAEAVTAELGEARTILFEEIRARTQETDLSVPVCYRGWWYYHRTLEGQQYARQCRVPAEPGVPRPALSPGTAPPGEQVLVDGNVEAAGGDYFALGASEVDLSGNRLAYAVDLAGDERFQLRIRDIATGELIDDAVSGTGYGVVWSYDGRDVYYTRVDESWRPYQVWRHEVGSSPERDLLIYQEDDEAFWMGLGVSRDDRTLVIAVASKTSSEVRLLDLTDPGAVPTLVAARRPGLEYDVEPAGDVLFITHNEHRSDFEVAICRREETDPARWRPWIVPAAGERITGVDVFASHVVVSLRREGLTALRVIPGEPAREVLASDSVVSAGWDVPVDEELFTIGIGNNPEWQSGSLQFVVESFLTPRTIAEIDLSSRQVTVLKRQPVLGGYDPDQYEQTRHWATAKDGTAIPLSVICRKGVLPDGTAPGLLYGYGAYEIPMDPWFSVARLSLLDRGVVCAVAHVRGGGELGRAWYDAGKLTRKPASFTDFVACARYLLNTGWVARNRLGAEGGSAGGLLVGAAVNLAPELFRVVHADVPFVDALTTILDPSLPLTVPEWEEWGNPVEDAEVYRCMRGYTPYENIRAVPYPAILATTSLNDTRVFVTEPAKWVARLRDTVTSDLGERPILLRTELVAGHGGKSGRYDAWRQLAWERAFVLDQLGVTLVPAGPGDASGS